MRAWHTGLIFLAACQGEPATSTENPASGTPATTAPTLDGQLDLVPRLAGLWSGSATQTPLGTFPLMNVDFRAMDDGLLWGRVDLDTENALRFGVELEDREPDALVYRNGGYFLGMLRDDRTELVEADPAGERWRFCHVELGCDYIDALYDFDGPENLVFDVKVRAEQHVLWTATRLEERSLPAGFPASVAAPDGPLPPMPEARIAVSWSTPLTDPADLWVILTVSDCTLGAGCAVSRSTRVTVDPGATQATAVLPEIHAGDYKAIAVLDRDRNLATSFLPGPQDGVSLPNRPVTVGPEGVSESSLAIVLQQ